MVPGGRCHGKARSDRHRGRLIALGLAGSAAAQEQPAAKKPAAQEAKRQGALFAAGAKVGKTLYISGKGDYARTPSSPRRSRIA